MVAMVEVSTFLTFINTTLIIGTILLGVSTYVFQKRTSLRESLEQLDSLWIEKRREYIGVFLHKFNYFPLIHESAILKFYVRRPTPNEKANVGMILNAEEIFVEIYDLSPEYFRKYDCVNKAWVDNSGLYVQTNTVDAVECRTLAEKIQIDLETTLIDRDELPR
jgi:hypothetical protein